MYYIDSRYRNLKKEEVYSTVELAVAAAEERVSTNYDGDTMLYVAEIKAIVQAELPVLPTKVAVVTSENIALVLEHKSDEDDS